jgi:hypothetical protein
LGNWSDNMNDEEAIIEFRKQIDNIIEGKDVDYNMITILELEHGQAISPIIAKMQKEIEEGIFAYLKEKDKKE